MMLLPPSASAADDLGATLDPAEAQVARAVEHNLPGPLTEKADAARKTATEQLVNGTATVEQRGTSTAVRLGDGQYVELARQRTDRIFTVLVEFGDQVDTTTTHDGEPKYGGTPGPLHNSIDRPDRAVDNPPPGSPTTTGPTTRASTSAPPGTP